MSDLLDLREYPPVMYMNRYGDGSQTWDRIPNDVFGKHEQIFKVIFSAKYIRADLVEEEIERRIDVIKKEIIK